MVVSAVPRVMHHMVGKQGGHMAAAAAFLRPSSSRARRSAGMGRATSSPLNTALLASTILCKGLGTGKDRAKLWALGRVSATAKIRVKVWVTVSFRAKAL